MSLRCIYLAQVPGDHSRLLPILAQLLPHEKERASQYLRPQDQCLHLASRWLLKQALLENTGEDTWRIVRDPQRKPRLAPEHGSSIEFSISHTRGLVVVGLTSTGEIGVDAEWVEGTKEVGGLSQSVLTSSEREWLAAQPKARLITNFLRLWTLKEAVLKGEGVGLGRDPLTINVDMGRGSMRLEEGRRDWAAWTWLEPHSGHVVACAMSKLTNVSAPEVRQLYLPSARPNSEWIH